METRKNSKGGRPALQDPAKHRHVLYLNDWQWEQSGVSSKSRFIAARIFGEPFRVVKVDKSAVEYCARLTEFYAQFRAVAVNYNQVVKALNSNFSEKKALAFLYKLEKATTELAMLNRQVKRVQGTMVAKISTGSSMFGALAYNQEKVDNGEAKVLFSNKMLLDEDGHSSIGGCMRSFEMQMPVHLSTKKPILHISINPHPEDVLSDSQLSDIAREYMRKLGYGDQPYLVYKHEDIDRHHIHIVGLRVDENGKPLNDRFEHRRSKQITRELERKYNLHPAERKERAERPELKKVDYAAGDVKHQIGNTVKAACYGYRFQSFGEYRALLATCNVCAEEVRGEINGRPYQGIVYSATDDKGEKVGNPVKASRIGKSVGYEAVLCRMEKSGKTIKDGKLKERTRKIVAAAMQTARNRQKFEQELKRQGIDVVFRQNDSGRIYGVTFIDHDSRVVLNGSRLGKEFSANVFNDLYSDVQTGQTESVAPQRGQGQDFTQQPHTAARLPVSGLGGLFGGSSIGEEPPQDTAGQKRKKKKKRTRRIE